MRLLAVILCVALAVAVSAGSSSSSSASSGSREGPKKHGHDGHKHGHDGHKHTKHPRSERNHGALNMRVHLKSDEKNSHIQDIDFDSSLINGSKHALINATSNLMLPSHGSNDILPGVSNIDVNLASNVLDGRKGICKHRTHKHSKKQGFERRSASKKIKALKKLLESGSSSGELENIDRLYKVLSLRHSKTGEDSNKILRLLLKQDADFGELSKADIKHKLQVLIGLKDKDLGYFGRKGISDSLRLNLKDSGKLGQDSIVSVLGMLKEKGGKNKEIVSNLLNIVGPNQGSIADILQYFGEGSGNVVRSIRDSKLQDAVQTLIELKKRELGLMLDAGKFTKDSLMSVVDTMKTIGDWDKTKAIGDWDKMKLWSGRKSLDSEKHKSIWQKMKTMFTSSESEEESDEKNRKQNIELIKLWKTLSRHGKTSDRKWKGMTESVWKLLASSSEERSSESRESNSSEEGLRERGKSHKKIEIKGKKVAIHSQGIKQESGDKIIISSQDKKKGSKEIEVDIGLDKRNKKNWADRWWAGVVGNKVAEAQKNVEIKKEIKVGDAVQGISSRLDTGSFQLGKDGKETLNISSLIRTHLLDMPEIIPANVDINLTAGGSTIMPVGVNANVEVKSTTVEVGKRPCKNKGPRHDLQVPPVSVPVLSPPKTGHEHRHPVHEVRTDAGRSPKPMKEARLGPGKPGGPPHVRHAVPHHKRH